MTETGLKIFRLPFVFFFLKHVLSACMFFFFFNSMLREKKDVTRKYESLCGFVEFSFDFCSYIKVRKVQNP